MTRVLLDVDPGCDDAVALCVALGHSAIDVVGITTVTGNAALDDTTRNTRSILELLTDPPPVAVGCDRPLVGELNLARGVHGPGGLRGRDALPDPGHATRPVDRTAPQFLVDRADDADVIVSVGPPTNVAVALALDPTLAERVDLRLMGGAVAVAGNVTPAAEANFFNDPEAARRVIRDWGDAADGKAAPTIVPLDVTERATIGTTDLPLAALERAGADSLASAIRAWLDYPTDALDRAGGRAAVHDAAAVADLTASVLEYDSAPARVGTAGDGRGALHADRRGIMDAPSARYATAIDVERFRRVVRDAVENLDQRV